MAVSNITTTTAANFIPEINYSKSLVTEMLKNEIKVTIMHINNKNFL